jgi:hypothetical protein
MPEIKQTRPGRESDRGDENCPDEEIDDSIDKSMDWFGGL